MSQEGKEIIFKSNITYHRTIYFAIMTGSARAKLLEKLYDIYIKDLLDKDYCAAVKLYGISPIYTEHSGLRDLYIDSRIIPYDFSRNHLCGKLYLAINDFLSNTSADWFVRLCDDTFINLHSFNSFFDEINSKYDPLFDRVVQGNCIHKPKKSYSYLQGGSGIIFSRFSALELNRTFDMYQTYCNKVLNDDTVIGIWLELRNYTMDRFTSRFFVGHRFEGFKKFIDLNLNTSKFERCKKQFVKRCSYFKFCRPFITNLKNIVFWHDRAKFMEFLPYAKKFINRLPDDLYYYQNDVIPKVCRSSENIDSYMN